MIEYIKRQTPRQLAIKILGLFLILALAVWVTNLAWHILSLRQSWRTFSSISQAGLENVPIPQAVALLDSSAGDLTAIQRDVRPLFPVLRVCSGLPLVGKYLGQVEPGLQYATGLARAGAAVSRGLLPVWEAIDRKQGKDMMATLVQALQTARPAMQQAVLDLESAGRARADLDPSLLPSDLNQKFQKLDSSFEMMRGSALLLQVLPGLLGAGETSTYLVLAQNSDELRATGGFITAIGLLDLQDGKITRFDIQDSYQADDLTREYPAPPEPLQRFMLSEIWLPRDANWSPDFPTSARKVQELYQLSTDIKTDGVVAFDQSAVTALLAVFGSVSVPGFDEPVNAANVQDYMHQAWAPEPEQGFSKQWWENRKNFIPELGKLLLQKILSARDRTILLNLASSSLNSLRAGHLLVYFSDAQAQKALGQMALDNSVSPGAGDYLELVDSNIGFNKTDPVVKRSIQYKIDLSNPGQPKAEFRAHYRHAINQAVACVHEAVYSQTYTGMQARCYWDYWRVLTRASRWTGSQAAPVAAGYLLNQQAWDGTPALYAGEGQTQAAGGLLVLPTQAEGDIVLQYDLQPAVVQVTSNELVYSLRIQKQPGLVRLPVELQVIAPENYRLASPPSGWLAGTDGQVWTWKGTLVEPLEFKLIFIRR